MARRRILNTMKRLEIAVERRQIDDVCRILHAHATGYTIVRDVSGCGHHGMHDGEMVLLVTIVTPDHLDPIIDGLIPILDERSGVVTIADVAVLRGEYFVPELKTTPSHDGAV